MAVLEPSESPTKANRAGKDGRGQEGELGQCMACQGRCVTASSGWARQGWQVRWVMDGPVGASLLLLRSGRIGSGEAGTACSGQEWSVRSWSGSAGPVRQVR